MVAGHNSAAAARSPVDAVQNRGNVYNIYEQKLMADRRRTKSEMEESVAPNMYSHPSKGITLLQIFARS
jgi:hypothetical protein